MTIREAKKEDIEKIENLLIQVSELHFEKRTDIIKRRYKEDIRSYIQEILNSKDKKILVLADEKDIYGLINYKIKQIKDNFSLKDSKVLWIDELVIDKDYRRKGYGKILIDEIKKISKQLNCDRIELNCWAFNKEAFDFYEKMGMKIQRVILEY